MSFASVINLTILSGLLALLGVVGLMHAILEKNAPKRVFLNVVGTLFMFTGCIGLLVLSFLPLS